jgi:hypothetical protein
MRKMLSVFACIACIVCVFPMLAACGRPAPEPKAAPTAAVAFAPVRDLLAQSCGVTCHGSERKSAGLDLSADKSWASLVNVASTENPDQKRVVSGDPKASYLLAKIRGDQGIKGVQMPNGGAPLGAEQQKLIEDWIAAGAPQ